RPVSGPRSGQGPRPLHPAEGCPSPPGKKTRTAIFAEEELTPSIGTTGALRALYLSAGSSQLSAGKPCNGDDSEKTIDKTDLHYTCKIGLNLRHFSKDCR